MTEKTANTNIFPDMLICTTSQQTAVKIPSLFSQFHTLQLLPFGSQITGMGIQVAKPPIPAAGKCS